MTAGLRLGRPGVYNAPRQQDTSLQPVRLDIAGFVGVAPRGPVDTPTPVSSWSDFERRFGGFERAGNAPDRLLPYALQAFFAQGGELAYIVRVAPPDDFAGPTADEATARYSITGERSGGWELVAADEGTWGAELAIRLDFDVTQSFRAVVRTPSDILLPTGADPPNCSLLRVRRADLPPTGIFRWLTRVVDPPTNNRAATVDEPLPDPPPGLSAAVDLDVVTGVLVVSDTSSPLRREERITGLGLTPGHPRWIASVLPVESVLVGATDAGAGSLVPGPFLAPRTAERLAGGLDRNHGIDFGSFFDAGGPDNDLLDELPRHCGADAMGRVGDLGLLCVPDLTWRSGPSDPVTPPPVRPTRPPSCCDVCGPPVPDLIVESAPVPAGLDARDPGDLAEIMARQDRLVQIAALRRRFVVLLDVPAGLPVRAITDWRTRFDTSYASAYHPWLGVPRGGAAGGGSVAVPPSSFAAGIIARRERHFGLTWGPANEIAQGAVLSSDVITDTLHDQLHLLNINVYRAERDGFRLSAARTLSSDPEYRQLSVRRLMTMLALTLERQTQWLVFEPNTTALRARLTHTVVQFLRGLHERGSFAGGSEEESFFVACDDALNPPQSQAQGRLIAEVGVAPAAPLEYLVLRISQDVDGTVSVGGQGG